MKMQEQARERLDREFETAAKSSNRYVAAVAQAVHDALVGFCTQQEEFARAACRCSSMFGISARLSTTWITCIFTGGPRRAGRITSR